MAVALAVLAACGPARQRAAEAPARAEQQVTISEYRLGPGDKIKVTVFGHQQESGEFEIDGSGALAYPLLGRVPAAGRTVAELQEALRRALDKGFIINPRLSVEVLNYRPFYIYGEVQRGGSYPYVAGLTVRRAVAIAGGFTRRARYSPVSVVRETRNGVVQFEAGLDVPVLPGDAVEVDRRLF